MVELLGWEANGLETTEGVSIEDYEDASGPPIYIDGWLTTIRDGLIHVAYWNYSHDGQRRKIVDRHVVLQRTVKEGRIGTDQAVEKTQRGMNA